MPTAPAFIPDGVTRHTPEPTPLASITVPGSIRTVRIPLQGYTEPVAYITVSSPDQLLGISFEQQEGA